VKRNAYSSVIRDTAFWSGSIAVRRVAMLSGASKKHRRGLFQFVLPPGVRFKHYQLYTRRDVQA
jgi:hypothetical protein